MKKSYPLLLLSMLCWQLSRAQNITGVVTDENKEPMVGVTVQVMGTSRGTATDINGEFVLERLSSGTFTVKFSYVGYKDQDKKVTLSGGQTVKLNIKMEPDPKMLDDVVAVGYGTQRRRDLSGSIVSIQPKEITAIPAPSFEAALQGQAAGVQVTVGSGLAGSASVVRVRGIASISAGGDPLYVIDGIPITQNNFLLGNGGGMNNNPLASINPNDIESIEILKDAASTGIYGSRGANGVILITTKRGRKKGLRYDFQARVGVSNPTARPDMLNSREYLQLFQEAWVNDGNVGLAPLPGGMSWDDAQRINTDWVDETVGTGFKQAYSFGVTKGTEKLNTYVNVSFDDNHSFLKGNSYQRLSGRFNADYQINSKLKAALSTSLSRGQNNRVDAAWSGGLGAAMSTALPIYPVRTDSGYFRGGSNPTMVRELKDWRTLELRTINNLALDYTVNNKLTIRATGSYDYMNLKDDQYDPQELILSTHAGTARRTAVNVNNYNLGAFGTYNLDRGAHRYTFLAGTEFQNSVTTSKYQEATDMTGPFYREDPNQNTIYQNRPVQQWAFISFFGRANYNYKGKYFATFTGRVDGSSRFGINNRYGFFPSASAAWIISEEAFLKYHPTISFMKLKAGYGRTGNADIPNYQRFGTFSPPGNQNPYNGQPTIYPTRLANPNLRWETSNVFDIGLEMGLWADRVTAELGFYWKDSRDVLMELAVPRSTGFATYWDNVGRIINNGIELTVRSRNVVDGPVKWTTTFNVARNYNEIKSIGVYSEDAVSGGTNDTRVVVGSPVGTNFLVRFSRVDAESGRPVYLDINGNETFKWDPADRVPVGDVLPDAVGGINNIFNYGQWEFSFFFTFFLGADIYESSAKRQLGVVTDWNMRRQLFDRWRQPGDNTEFPRLTQNTQTYGSGTPWINTTQWLHDGSFARLRTLSLTYMIPNEIVKKWKLTNAAVNFTASNILTFTKFRGLDPEIARDFENATDRNMSPNITYLTPPQEKTYNIAVTIGF